MTESTNNKAIDKIAHTATGVTLFSTIKDDTREGKLKTLAAISNAKPINEHLDTPLALENVIMQAVEIDNDGEAVDAVRTYLITADGEAYAAVSDGIVGSLRDIFGIMGEPSSWGEPLPVKVTEMRGKKGFRFMKIVLA